MKKKFKLFYFLYRMEVMKQNRYSENFLEITKQAEVRTQESAKESGPLLPEQLTVLDYASKIFLEAILPSILGCKKMWPQKMLAAIIKRFGRMPKNNWTITRAYFNNKFQITIPPDIFNKKAQETLVTTSGRACSSRQYKMDPVKRVKTIDSYIEERTFSEVKIHNELKVKYLSWIKEIAEKQIGDIGATRNIAGLEIDQVKLEAISRIAGEYSLNHPHQNMKDVAIIYIAAQIYYQEATERPYQSSQWRTSIEAKLQKLRSQSELLKKFIDLKAVDSNSKSEAIKIMRSKRLILDKLKSIQKTVSEYEDSILVYQKKIDIY